MKRRKEIWEFIKEHKTEITVTTLTLMVGVMIGRKLYGKKIQPYLTTDLMEIEKPKRLDINDLGVGKLDLVDIMENGIVELMIGDLSINDIGKVGEAIADKIPDIPENAKVWTLLSIQPNE